MNREMSGRGSDVTGVLGGPSCGFVHWTWACMRTWTWWDVGVDEDIADDFRFVSCNTV